MGSVGVGCQRNFVLIVHGPMHVIREPLTVAAVAPVNGLADSLMGMGGWIGGDVNLHESGAFYWLESESLDGFPATPKHGILFGKCQEG